MDTSWENLTIQLGLKGLNSHITKINKQRRNNFDQCWLKLKTGSILRSAPSIKLA